MSHLPVTLACVMLRTFCVLGRLPSILLMTQYLLYCLWLFIAYMVSFPTAAHLSGCCQAVQHTSCLQAMSGPQRHQRWASSSQDYQKQGGTELIPTLMQPDASLQSEAECDTKVLKGLQCCHLLKPQHKAMPQPPVCHRQCCIL